MSPVEIPSSFTGLVAGRAPEPDVSGDDWLVRLPALIDRHLDAWDLVPDGEPWHGECALVVPVRRGRERLVLKLTWPHREAAQEHLALRAWNGRGAVRLHAADPAAYALLLERLDGDRDLRGEPILDACETIGEIFRRLDQPALPQVPRLSGLAARWVRDLRAGHADVPRRMTTQAASLLADLAADATDSRLVHADLHFANVLAGERESWLAIDPKPVAGEWAYAVAPAIWNRADDAARAHNLRVHLRLRAALIADAAGLDEERVRAWTFVRLMINALDAATHLPESAAFHGRMIAAAKAFAD